MICSVLVLIRLYGYSLQLGTCFISDIRTFDSRASRIKTHATKRTMGLIKVFFKSVINDFAEHNITLIINLCLSAFQLHLKTTSSTE